MNMNQHQVSPGLLLNEKGELNEAGYAFSLAKEYNRESIATNKWRIKEWDYYYIGDEHFGVALTIDDNGYMGLGSLSLLDFEKKTYINQANMFWFCFGKVKLPRSSENGDVAIKGKDYSYQFFNHNGERHLLVKVDKFHDDQSFSCDIKLSLNSDKSMVICTPFKKKKHFYYNQKINLLRASGSFTFGDVTHEFLSHTTGILDWGRGVWTYKNTWYWSSLNGYQDGHYLGWNLGYGFGDTSQASENMFFIDDKAYKLDDVSFNIPQKDGYDDYLHPWTLTSQSGNINLSFAPVLDRHDKSNAVIIAQDAHQVFGHFSGTITTPDGVVEIHHLLGFAEKVSNKW